MTFEQLYTAVRDQGGFDTGSTGSTLDSIKQWINEQYERMVVEAKWRKAQVELALTVAGQAEYALPATVVDIIEGILVGSTPYGGVGQETLWRLKAGFASVDGPVWAEDYTASGAVQLELYPVPETAGESIQALATLAPVALNAAGDVPIIPVDFHGDLIDAAIGLGYVRLENRPDIGQPKLDRFDSRIEVLRRRGNARLSPGPIQAQVGGYAF